MPRIELSELERQKMAKAGADSISCTHGWRPIETAPKDGSKILTVWLGNVEIAIWDIEQKNWQEWPDGDYMCVNDEITHWQPLPKPPRG